MSTLHDTTDAQLWAEEFCRIFDGQRVNRATNDEVDIGLMISWFANAIEVGRNAGRREWVVSDEVVVPVGEGGVQTVDLPGPRRFVLQRDEDVTGISGTGVVAEGVEFSDGVVCLHWQGNWPSSIVHYDRGMESVEHVHGHGGSTRIVMLDG